eukprot:gnl/TRDRNA2_/TRDRNA2_156095_c0_seq2.p1 gnl/TRDRNA2_/TRDRNA2_156095_c0~~gnl/TRDRNA2_/TRDRNA2_156095_c0_seq2.p1  ORF type:complete len:296 (-),score=43.12 gnl/TRDRNA2_/TRDRNA2_156095_c0_seq2:21-908(-)
MVTRAASQKKIGIVGKNGSGKSTLLSLLAGRLKFYGDLWSHNALRLVYIAQHSESQLGDFMGCTPLEYIQLRFRKGYDAEMPWKPPPPPTKRVQSIARQHGKRGKEVEDVVSRSHSDKEKECLYEVKWKGLGPGENTFEKMERLRFLGVEHLATRLNEMLSAAWGEAPERPLTTREIQQHLEDFGLSEDIACHRQISMLSSGQRVKLLLAASFWTRPHIVCLDEPTNYLDADTVDALRRALRSFKGGYVIVSHCEPFIDDVCDEIWAMDEGQLTIRKTNSRTGAGSKKGGYPTSS